MIEPQKAMFLYKPSETLIPGRMIVVSSEERGRMSLKEWPGSLGACFVHWKTLSDDEVYQCMHWTSLWIAEFTGISIGGIRDAMAEKVRGFREYDSRIGRMALGHKKRD